MSIFWKIQYDNIGLFPAFVGYAILILVQCKCQQNLILLGGALVLYALKVTAETFASRLSPGWLVLPATRRPASYPIPWCSW